MFLSVDMLETTQRRFLHRNSAVCARYFDAYMRDVYGVGRGVFGTVATFLSLPSTVTARQANTRHEMRRLVAATLLDTVHVAQSIICLTDEWRTQAENGHFKDPCPDFLRVTPYMRHWLDTIEDIADDVIIRAPIPYDKLAQKIDTLLLNMTDSFLEEREGDSGADMLYNLFDACVNLCIAGVRLIDFTYTPETPDVTDFHEEWFAFHRCHTRVSIYLKGEHRHNFMVFVALVKSSKKIFLRTQMRV